MLGSGSLMAQSMSDSQVLEYVKDGIRQGKEQKQLASELARKGVTKEQAMRVKQLYEQQNNVNTSQSTGTDINESRLREETKENTSDMLEDHPTTEDLAREDQVFGRNIFNTRNLTFEPSVNLATPANYRLGPGDEVIIDIWGASQNTIRQQISPEGTINIQKIGPVNLSGMTVSAANDYLKGALNKIYNGLNNTTDPTSDIRLTLGNIRTIQINVMGEVVQPGTYALSSFSTVFHALYRAGGVSDIGSLRNVQLVRNGKNIATIDVYEFIMKGNTQDDIRLQEGDVVIVPAYDVLVKISGKVKRPMRFEMKKDENLATLIKYAGGFEADAYTRSLRVVRQNGEEYEVNTVKDMDYSIYTMCNGDVVTAEAILNRFTNKLEIRGAVYRPGIYQLSGKLNTVRELVHEAQGLTGDAFLNRAVLYRQREDLTSEVVQIDIKSIMDGTSPNLALMKNDILYIPSIHDLEDRGNVTVHGEVAHPDSYPYADNMTLEDLIIQAGGLKEAASTVRIDVSRRIKNPRSTADNDTIGQMYTFSLKDGFVIDGQPGFILQPYDEVYVRRSPGYQAQQNVVIDGEILFGGNYAMTNREERLSDLVNKAGGPTNLAYLRGAKLTRVASAGEKKRMGDVIRLMSRQLGEAMIDSLGIGVEDTFTVGIDLEKALTNPKGSADLVLREGDVVFIPKNTNTVTINGAVMVPNTVSYMKG
ncbi:capsule biosynthesis protein, partial [Bacteroides thetaiotaomicron]|nr:capsule biosynthesis protein [Bacteroides thetaiotaomicron]